MKAVRAALVAMLLATLCAAADAQDRRAGSASSAAAFSLEPAAPNPFEKETRIPFLLYEELFEGRQRVTVSVHIYNLLHQLIAVPLLIDVSGDVHRLDGLAIPSVGRYEAVWDGRDLAGNKVTEGPYFVQLLIGGRSQVRKVLYVR